ncbi:MAG TPA: SseB family protein [Actinomycetales bacterium]|nr:SseB family protein [Actinomycetales bacterium]
MSADGPADSAGVPWAGRTLSPHGFESDDGTAPRELVTALADGDTQAILSALAGARVLVPVVAVLGESKPVSAEPGALHADKSADMALVTLKSPDGRAALPVFTSVQTMAAWDAAARPVPVESRRAALSAVDEGCSLLVIDPAGPATAVLPRPALWALAQGHDWTPATRDPQVHAAVRDAVRVLEPVVDVSCEPGERAELRIVLAVRPGLDREGLDALTSAVSQRLAASEVVAERVDSLELKVRPASV